MPRQPKDITSLSERLKSAELLMGSKVSKKLTMEDLEALALFIIKSQTLINDLGQTLNIKLPNVNTNNTSNNQSYNGSNSIYNNPVRPYQPPQQQLNTIVTGSGVVSGHDPNKLGFGSMGDVSAYNPELDFINNSQPPDMPIIVPTPEQLEVEAKLLNGVFTLPEDVEIIDTNAIT